MSPHGDGKIDTDGERVATVDVANFEILAALRQPGCPLCAVDELAEGRLVQSFLREGRYNPATREAFTRSGGFCPRHAWRLHRQAQADATGAGIADIYGQLVARDAKRLAATSRMLGTRRGRRRARRGFRRPAGCQLCGAMARSRGSHGHFLAQLLADERARDAFSASEGLCSLHLDLAIPEALHVDRRGGVASFLLDDARSRLEVLGAQLAEYNRKRDYRYAAERRGAEQRSWTEVIRRYVGEAPGHGREQARARADQTLGS